MQQQVNAKQFVILKKNTVFHNKKGQSIASPPKNMDKSQIY